MDNRNNMKDIKIKAVFLWSTAFFTAFTILAIEGMFEISYFLPLFCVSMCAIMITACVSIINETEFKAISGYNMMSKWLKLED